MTYVEHANNILDFLALRRDPSMRILELTNTDLLKATTDANPSDYAVAYGQANSLLDIASMEADLPLIGRLIVFDHQDDPNGPWSNWLPFASLLFYSAPRVMVWSDADIAAIRKRLKPGRPSTIWKEMEPESKVWLERALIVAQRVIRTHVDQYLDEKSKAL